MDISIPSNFERLLFDVGGRDGAALAEQMRGFETSKAMRLTNAQREGAAGDSCRNFHVSRQLSAVWG